MKTNTNGASLWKAGWGRDHLCVVQARDGFRGGKSHWKVKESPIGSTLHPTLYYLDDIPREELLQAFPSIDYTHSQLGFFGNYGSLQDRDCIELGHGALNYAIINLYYGRSQPNALLVIIQMVAEAGISLENRWSDLSQQIQWSGESGVFHREIQVRSALNAVVSIRNVEDSMSLAALALNNVVPSREM
nr:ribosome-inactivating protein bryodin II-like [Tanacetum cinerariifolium]